MKPHWLALARDCRAMSKEMGWTLEDHRRLLEKARAIMLGVDREMSRKDVKTASSNGS